MYYRSHIYIYIYIDGQIEPLPTPYAIPADSDKATFVRARNVQSHLFKSVTYTIHLVPQDYTIIYVSTSVTPAKLKRPKPVVREKFTHCCTRTHHIADTVIYYTILLRYNNNISYGLTAHE